MRGGSGKEGVLLYEECVLIVMYDMAWLPFARYAGFKSVSVRAVYWVMYKTCLQHKLSEDGAKSPNRLIVKIYADNAFPPNTSMPYTSGYNLDDLIACH